MARSTQGDCAEPRPRRRHVQSRHLAAVEVFHALDRSRGAGVARTACHYTCSLNCRYRARPRGLRTTTERRLDPGPSLAAETFARELRDMDLQARPRFQQTILARKAVGITSIESGLDREGRPPAGRWRCFINYRGSSSIPSTGITDGISSRTGLHNPASVLAATGSDLRRRAANLCRQHEISIPVIWGWGHARRRKIPAQEFVGIYRLHAKPKYRFVPHI
jgi:hypothetical protein